MCSSFRNSQTIIQQNIKLPHRIFSNRFFNNVVIAMLSFLLAFAAMASDLHGRGRVNRLHAALLSFTDGEYATGRFKIQPTLWTESCDVSPVTILNKPLYVSYSGIENAQPWASVLCRHYNLLVSTSYSTGDYWYCWYIHVFFLCFMCLDRQLSISDRPPRPMGTIRRSTKEALYF